MSFWLPALAIPLVAALVLAAPLLARGGGGRGLGIALLLALPLVVLFLYRGVGEPEGIDPRMPPPAADPASTEFDDLVTELRDRLDQQPEDAAGWLLLGRSYKALQRFPEALEALRRARALAPGDPLVAVELAEALIFTSTGPAIDPEVQTLLEEAIAQEPELQKGLWLLGIVASQAGDDAAALAWWERLLPLLEPGSGVATAVSEQLAQARARVGEAVPPPAAATEAAWPGVTVRIDVAPGLEPIPDGAVLFIIARDPAAPTPPLGAVRVPQPRLPLTLSLGDANSMLAQRPISSVERIEVLARLSLSGAPTASPGDPESEPVTLHTASATTVDLLLSPPD